MIHDSVVRVSDVAKGMGYIASGSRSCLSGSLASDVREEADVVRKSSCSSK